MALMQSLYEINTMLYAFVYKFNTFTEKLIILKQTVTNH